MNDINWGGEATNGAEWEFTADVTASAKTPATVVLRVYKGYGPLHVAAEFVNVWNAWCESRARPELRVVAEGPYVRFPREPAAKVDNRKVHTWSIPEDGGKVNLPNGLTVQAV